MSKPGVSQSKAGVRRRGSPGTRCWGRERVRPLRNKKRARNPAIPRLSLDPKMRKHFLVTIWDPQHAFTASFTAAKTWKPPASTRGQRRRGVCAHWDATQSQ